MPVNLILKTYNRTALFVYQLLALSFFCILFTGCGYRLGQGSIPDTYDTISVPYVCGDIDGALTSAIIKEIEANSGLSYTNHCGSLILSINLLDLRDQNIGFRYDRDKRDRVTDCIVPTETRITAIVEVKVIEACSGKIVMGPVILSSNKDFDHDYYSSRNGVNIFSLGQLNDIDAARDAVKTPLNRALARKIVEYVNESW
ncbi:MAG: hypothetical protein AAGG81_07385 [Chlamydiota bacterium]